ncbi:MAG: (d)CMP kinase [Eubacterium sp.]|nr:(d)CMP kinase [Eubacterium sp.]
MNIAIDGPAGAGKSSIAKRVANELNFIYVDTGAMFRSMAYYFLMKEIDTEDEEAVSGCCDDITIEIKYVDEVQHVILNGEDVSTQIRKEEVGKQASIVAKYPAVRTKLLELQRAMAAKYDVIMDGRDIGTVVLPDADVKIYLTASASVRAERRYKELVEKGETCDLKKIEQDIIQRDEQDMNREIAPLKQAEDAVLVDSSYMTIEEVIDKIKEIAGK